MENIKLVLVYPGELLFIGNLLHFHWMKTLNVLRMNPTDW